MRWIAPAVTMMLVAGLLADAALAQISATPAARFTPSTPLTPANSLPTSTVGRSPESEQIRGWYRDYLGRDVGPDLSAWVELGMGRAAAGRDVADGCAGVDSGIG
jgi:hypothetical protein